MNIRTAVIIPIIEDLLLDFHPIMEDKTILTPSKIIAMPVKFRFFETKLTIQKIIANIEAIKQIIKTIFSRIDKFFHADFITPSHLLKV